MNRAHELEKLLTSLAKRLNFNRCMANLGYWLEIMNALENPGYEFKPRDYHFTDKDIEERMKQWSH
jgi:predicted fused transcriptional regulator/phosphomethylpyrimidine kinase